MLWEASLKNTYIYFLVRSEMEKLSINEICMQWSIVIEKEVQ